jgi:ectoine hydroxylase-related dioxygenase (phytanoyl-CoA dioxygenase family)
MPDVTADAIDEAAIAYYRGNGFLRVRDLLSPEEAATFAEAVVGATDRAGTRATEIFTQNVNVWQQDETVRGLTLHERIGKLATRLAGVPLRLWHDQTLLKQAGKAKPTEFHQDSPYWPHDYGDTGDKTITCWIALEDVPVDRGCMTFLPGSQQKLDLPMQILSDARSLFAIDPDLEYGERVTVPLRAGDCTFHTGRCAHMANANTTDRTRVAHAIIMMPADTRFAERPHLVTKPLVDAGQLATGDLLEGDLFPEVAGA